MSSPIKKRTALSGKSTNIKTSTIHKGTQHNGSFSPSKRSQVNVGYALRHSPVRNVSVSSLEKMPSLTLPFVIHEETPDERAAILMNHMSLSKGCIGHHDENDFSGVKENMSPDKLHQKTKSESCKSPGARTTTRRPLSNLSISEHKGYLEDPRTREVVPLTLHYTKKIKLPSFVTPPRDKRLRQYFSTMGQDDDHPQLFVSRSTDDIPKDKIVRKLNFKICEN